MVGRGDEAVWTQFLIILDWILVLTSGYLLKDHLFQVKSEDLSKFHCHEGVTLNFPNQSHCATAWHFILVLMHIHLAAQTWQE